jgi:hypothetical protein
VITLRWRLAFTAAVLLLVASGVGYVLVRPKLHGATLSKLTIVKQPSSHSAMSGQPTTFEVTVKGIGGPRRYRWFRNDVEIPGATNATYTMAAVAPADNASRFTVQVRNWLATRTSADAILKVLAPLPAKGVAFPLEVSSNRRYLVDQTGKPFRIQGEAAWSLIANLTYDEADKYLSNRQAKGFNTVLAELIEHKYAQGGKGKKFEGVPKNRAGALPFVKRVGGGSYNGSWGTADFSTPNEAYFAFADSIIDLAARKGILVNLTPMFLGFAGGDAGWWADLTNTVNTQTVVYNFGLYVGRRYKDRKNVIWVIGGDYFPRTGSEGEARLLKFLQGIKAGGATQLWSGDWKASCLSVDEAAFTSLMDLNAVYTYGILGHSGATYDEARVAYAYSPAKPAYLKETGYEGEDIYAGDSASVRMYEYYAILGGTTTGGFFGNFDVWKFGTDRWWFAYGGPEHHPWQISLESEGTFDFAYLGRLLDSVAWYNLVPSGLSGMPKLVVDGGGNYTTTDYVVAEATTDGSTLLAYVPPRREANASITIDMAALRGQSTASWFDPTSGTSLDVPGGPFPNLAARSFQTPGRNERGDTDWVLILRVK